MSQKVQGHCPACGSTSLFLGSGGYVTCAVSDCTDPGMASDLLLEPEIHHVIEFRSDGWTIKHPLRCRPGLFECEATKAAQKLDGPPAQPGRYHMIPLGDGTWAWGRLA